MDAVRIIDAGDRTQRLPTRAASISSRPGGMLAGMPEEPRRAAVRLANLLSGVAQLGAGRADIARTYLDAERRLGEPAGEIDRWWSKALEGEIALADGDFQKASAAFAAGEPTGRMWFSLQQRTVTLLANDLMLRDGPARVAQARGDLAGAIQIYRRLLVYDRDQQWVADVPATLCLRDCATARTER